MHPVRLKPKTKAKWQIHAKYLVLVMLTTVKGHSKLEVFAHLYIISLKKYINADIWNCQACSKPIYQQHQFSFIMLHLMIYQSVTVQKARDPIASENRIFIWNTPNTVDVKKSTAVQVQIYRPCRCRSHRQCRCSEPGRAEFTARAENTVRTRQGIYRNVTRREQPPDLEDWHRELTKHQRNNDLTTHHRNASQI